MLVLRIWKFARGVDPLQRAWRGFFTEGGMRHDACLITRAKCPHGNRLRQRNTPPNIMFRSPQHYVQRRDAWVNQSKSQIKASFWRQQVSSPVLENATTLVLIRHSTRQTSVLYGPRKCTTLELVRPSTRQTSVLYGPGKCNNTSTCLTQYLTLFSTVNIAVRQRETKVMNNTMAACTTVRAIRKMLDFVGQPLIFVLF